MSEFGGWGEQRGGDVSEFGVWPLGDVTGEGFLGRKIFKDRIFVLSAII